MISVFLMSIVTAATLAAEPAPDARSLIERAKGSMAAKQYGPAAEAYEQAAQAMPESPELAYDRGVALYRKGDYAKAAESFGRALMTNDRALEAKAKFNLGNCAYATALAKKEDGNAAMQQLKLASAHYRDAIEADPQDADARANIELTQRLIKILEEKKKEQQQQGGDDKDDKKDKKDDKKQPQSQPSSQASSQPDSSEEKKDEKKSQDQKNGQQGKSEKGDQKESSGEKKEGEQQQAEQKDGKDQKAEEQKGKLESAQKGDEEDDKKDQQQAQAVPTTQIAISKEEAEKLLQLIRDKERQRAQILQQMRQKQAKHAPVEKDW